MKKVYLLLAALVCAFVCIIGLNLHAKTLLDDNIEKAIYYNNISSKNWSDYVMEKVLDERSIVVVGSSELSFSNSPAYPPKLFNYGNSDFNMVLMGSGYFQCIPQAINVGALSNNTKNNKIVLIISPQWFTHDGLTSESFCSRFEETNFVEFLKNDSISKETRIAVANRVNELLTSDPTALARVEKDERLYIDGSLNLLTRLEMAAYNSFRAEKAKFETAHALKSQDLPIEQERYVKAEDINWNELMLKSADLGVESCTNNTFGVNDDYYTTYMADKIASLKGSYSGASYVESPEYDDFRLFLDVCKELNIEPLIISAPVNGRWYDYAEFSKADRNTYYQNIRDICREYNVKLADFSQKEYEIYFLRDIMHLGWKGWVYLDRAVYEFYNNQPITDTTTYEILTPEATAASDGAEVQNDGSYRLAGYGQTDAITISLPHEQTELDHTNKAEYRSGTYLHTGESGTYTVRMAWGDVYVDSIYFLEKGSIYQIKYDVAAISSTCAVVDDFTFSKISY